MTPKEYKYDAEGNRIEKKSKNGETTKYEWDHRNRLVKTVTPKETADYVYDFRNRLVKRGEEFFVHDGWQIAMVLDKSGAVTEKNLWGANQDELIATNDSFMLCDHLGTIRDIVDTEGNVCNHLEYNAFGKLLKYDGIAPRFRYTGKPFDDTTGLQWNINRWYDAETGRWISEDPIGFGGMDVNLFRYVLNSSIYYFDPIGFENNAIQLVSDTSLEEVLHYTHSFNGITTSQGTSVNYKEKIGHHVGRLDVEFTLPCRKIVLATLTSAGTHSYNPFYLCWAGVSAIPTQGTIDRHDPDDTNPCGYECAYASITMESIVSGGSITVSPSISVGISAGWSLSGGLSASYDPSRLKTSLSFIMKFKVCSNKAKTKKAWIETPMNISWIGLQKTETDIGGSTGQGGTSSWINIYTRSWWYTEVVSN